MAVIILEVCRPKLSAGISNVVFFVSLANQEPLLNMDGVQSLAASAAIDNPLASSDCFSVDADVIKP
jgi:hypothetical protein